MHPLVIHFASGHALFTGAGMLLGATVLWLVFRNRRFKVGTRLIGVTGGVLLALSATPLPLWLCVSLWIAIPGWLVFMGTALTRFGRAARVLCILTQVLCVTTLSLEAPWHMTPKAAAANYSAVYIVGDSITAGINPGETTWPDLFHERHHIQVVDLSRAGETTASALPAANRITEENSLVILEIGGNDLLNRHSADRFSHDVEELLKAIHAPGRAMVMLELPLPPLHGSFGVAQRRLSKKYNVTLIPKRHFARIFGGRDTTVDGLHLSQQGHDRMADLMSNILGNAPSEAM